MKLSAKCRLARGVTGVDLTKVKCCCLLLTFRPVPFNSTQYIREKLILQSRPKTVTYSKNFKRLKPKLFPNLGGKSVILLLAEPVLPKFGGGASLQNDFDFRLLFL